MMQPPCTLVLEKVARERVQQTSVKSAINSLGTERESLPLTSTVGLCNFLIALCSKNEFGRECRGTTIAVTVYSCAAGHAVWNVINVMWLSHKHVCTYELVLPPLPPGKILFAAKCTQMKGIKSESYPNVHRKGLYKFTVCAGWKFLNHMDTHGAFGHTSFSCACILFTHSFHILVWD